MAATEGKIPNWRVTGDWFDVCKCNIPCPCEFAQTPTYGDCEGILAYNVKIGNYGKTSLDGLNVLAVGSFKGNILGRRWHNKSGSCIIFRRESK